VLDAANRRIDGGERESTNFGKSNHWCSEDFKERDLRKKTAGGNCRNRGQVKKRMRDLKNPQGKKGKVRGGEKNIKLIHASNPDPFFSKTGGTPVKRREKQRFGRERAFSGEVSVLRQRSGGGEGEVGTQKYVLDALSENVRSS